MKNKRAVLSNRFVDRLKNVVKKWEAVFAVKAVIPVGLPLIFVEARLTASG